MPDPSPILNNSYEEPRFHYATNLKGEIDYATVVEHCRRFFDSLGPLPKS